MDLPNALMQLSRNTELMAVRPRGVAITMSAGHVMLRLGKQAPYKWVPNFGDIIADDWFVGTLEACRQANEAWQGATE